MRAAVVVKLVLGGLLAFMGLSCGAIGVGMTVAPTKPDDPESGVIIMILAVLMFAVPGAALLWLGLRGRTYDRQLAHVAAMGQSASRLPLQEIAQQLGVTKKRAGELVLDAISQHKMVGRMDYEQDVFISGAAHQGVQQLSLRCPTCGGVSEVFVTAGTTSTCRFCGQRLA